jgi:hypothetical protein
MRSIHYFSLLLSFKLKHKTGDKFESFLLNERSLVGFFSLFIGKIKNFCYLCSLNQKPTEKNDTSGTRSRL